MFKVREILIMSEKNKKAILNDEDLKKVFGGTNVTEMDSSIDKGDVFLKTQPTKGIISLDMINE